MNSYFEFCACFEEAHNGLRTISSLESEADRLGINFDDFCDANDFTESYTWEECVKEYGEQIDRGER